MRRYFLIRLFICILLLLMLLPFYCYCEESVYDFSDLLPEYSENSTFEKATETVTTLQNYLKPQKILDLLSGNLISFGKSTFLSFGICFSLILCYGVLSSIKSGFSQNDSGFEFIANLIFICVAFSPLSLCFTKVTNHIYASCGYMLSFVPVSAALYAASGNTLTASGSTVTFQSAILATELISCSVILPLSKAICVLTTVNAVNRRLNFTGLCSFLKSLCLWIMGLCFTMFTGLLSLQTILNSACDNLAMKGLRYSASKLIPIAGGLISDSMRTVISSVCFIKSAGGIGGIVFIIYTLIPPLCALIMTKLLFSLISALAKAVDAKDFCAICDGINGVLNILSALMISSSAAFIIMLTVFIKTAVTL